MSQKNIQDIYPLSPLQQGMLFHTLYAPESGAYFQQVVFTLPGPLQPQKLREAWQQVLNRHPILRTVFIWKKLAEPRQVVQRHAALPWQRLDWQDVPEPEQAARLQQFLKADREKGFDLATCPLMRFALVQVAPERYQLIWSHHHILLDGWSLPLLLAEVAQIYEAGVQGRQVTLPTPKPYRDYIRWLLQQDEKKTETFWRKTLAGVQAATPLGMDRGRPAAPPLPEDFGKVYGTLAVAGTERLQTVARQHRLTLNTLIQGAWALLLARYNNRQDVLFGTTVSGRPAEIPGVERMIGLFINALPVRIRLAEDVCLLDWLQQIQAEQLDRQQYAHASLADVHSWSDVPGGEPLFESLLVFENYPMAPTAPGRNGETLQIEAVTSWERTNYPLNIIVSPQPHITVSIGFDRRRFTDAAIAQIRQHFLTLLEQMPSQLQKRLTDVSFLPESERTQQPYFTNRPVPAAASFCLHERFAAQAAATPDATAVTHGKQAWTYRELEQRANQLARYLQTMGVRPGTPVGLYVERTPEIVLGILGILKAGGAYLPLDPIYPQERIRMMLADAQATILLTQSQLVTEVPEWPGVAHRVCLDADWSTIAQQETAVPPTGVTPDHLAYIIYTSGSTGTPKGVMVSHRHVARLFAATETWYRFTDTDVWTLFHSYAFDFSVWEMWGALLYGGRLVIVSQEASRDPAGFAKLLRQEGVTVLNQTPSAFRQLIWTETAVSAASPLPLRLVILGGEALNPAMLQPWYERYPETQPQIVNMYGITETTVHVTYRPLGLEDVQAGAGSLIGRPIPDLAFYLLDPKLRPVPVGVPGEIYVGGAGVARGYWQRPGQTAARFVPDPFAEQEGARLYRTGDLARYTPAGDVEYLGRIDHQVQVRGHRVELGEIEAILQRETAVKACVVLAQETGAPPGDVQLAAYLVPSPGEPPPTVARLHHMLAQKLPNYMLPGSFFLLDEMPITANGKIDRKALQTLGTVPMTPEVAYEPAGSPFEEILVEIWEEVFQRSPIGIHDNFFQLGGHSLTATQVISRVCGRFEIEVPVRALFDAPTIAGLAAAVEEILIAEIQSVEDA